MSHSYDPILKALVETAPADWLPLLGLPQRRVSIEDADIASVTSGAADKVLRVHDNPEYLLHLEFQSGHDSANLPRRLKLYNGVLEYRHDRPVLSAANWRLRIADCGLRIGDCGLRIGDCGLRIADCGLEIAEESFSIRNLQSAIRNPQRLAPISDVSAARLPEVVRRMQERLGGRQERRAQEVWGAAFVLVGLRYSEEFARRLFREVLHMKESVTYQAIIEEGRAEGRTEGRTEGRAEEARRLLLRLGQKRLGPPDEAVRAAIQALTDVERLEKLAERLHQVDSWQQLLKPTKPRRRNGRKPAT